MTHDELLTKLREGVEGLPRLRRYVDDSELIDLTEVLALIEKLEEGRGMTHDELLAKIKYLQVKQMRIVYNALYAVVELIQEKQKFLEETKGDIPMTNQQLGAREERTKLLAEIKQAIEKELG